MKPLKELIEVPEAVDRVLGAVRPVEGTERVGLAKAGGRVLAADVASSTLVPPFARSAMDGYAVRAEDTFPASREEPVRLALRAVVHAGAMPEGVVESGTCFQIATGAPLPEGANAVVKVEDTDRDGEGVVFKKPAHPRQNVAPAGEDIRPGDVVVARGRVLTPSRVGAAAALGLTELDVFRKPRVTIFTTGDEIHPPGEPLRPGKVYDINSYTVGALLDSLGVTWEKGGNVVDEPPAIGRALDKGKERDLLLFSGGSSAGERDLLVDVLRERGEVVFHGVAMKPGKPTLFGRVGGTLVFGLPGFPASCLAVAQVLIVPCVRKLAHLPPGERRLRRLPLASKIPSSIGRHQFFSVRIEGDRVHPAFKESGDITSLSAADGYVEIPSTVEFLAAGEEVEVVLT
ncbi:MAG: molybdopterin molybdotransferase MoeA [Planctomycetota bacterium]